MTGVLVGDVGGTKARIARAHRRNGWIELENVIIFDDPEIASFDAVIAAYLDDHDGADHALFALAGPIEDDGSITLTNRTWPTISPTTLKERFGFATATLVNDFAAMARAVPEVPDSQFVSVRAGQGVPNAPILVTGPGTGFGVSTLIRRANDWFVLTGEGGHAAYAPRTEFEAHVLSIMQAKHGFVSTESIVSGKWLMPVYEAICEIYGNPPQDLEPQDMLDAADRGDPIAKDVCLMRAQGVLGAAGDAALITGAQGGVVLTGGVAERIVPWLRAPEALERFTLRGPRTDYLAHIPISIMKSDEAPLIGAAALYFDQEANP